MNKTKQWLLRGGGFKITFILVLLYVVILSASGIYNYIQFGVALVGWAGFVTILQALFGGFVVLYFVSLLQGIYDNGHKE